MNNQLPASLYSAEQVRTLDEYAIERLGIDGYTLLQRAGQAAFAQLRSSWPEARKIAVFAGKGNNGGDAIVLATLAYQQGLKVTLYYFSHPDQANSVVKQAIDQAKKVGLWSCAQPVSRFTGELTADVVVDGILGTGVSGPVRGEFQRCIEQINASQLAVLALDIPSGLAASTGAGATFIQAQHTITFVGLKTGLLTGRGPACCGKISYADLSLPAAVFQQVKPQARRLTADVQRLFPPRPQDAHKGDFGHVLIIGGDQGYGGAVMMAAEAAMTTGVGLVTVATQPCHITPLLCRRPEVMAWGITQSEQLIPLLAKASALVVGPGLGQTHWSRQLLETALASELPVVLDADGLNLLAQSPLLHKRANWLLTPHPGEAARLLAAANNPLATSQQVQADRPSAVAGLQHHYGGVAVLKGAGTLICGEQQPLLLCPLGNPGMASGGMGDVLSGVLGGLLAQGLSLLDSAQLGVWLHSRSGDLAAEKAGKRGLLATDLLSWLRTIETGSNLQD